MSRINDVGGMSGFSRIVEEPDEPPFHADWEAHVFTALSRALIGAAIYNLDEVHDARRAHPRHRVPGRLVLRAMVPAPSGRCSSRRAWRRRTTWRCHGRPFRPGDRVRTRSVDPDGHTRLPRYARGAVGVVVEPAGRHPLADERARGATRSPRPSTTCGSPRPTSSARATTVTVEL